MSFIHSDFIISNDDKEETERLDFYVKQTHLLDDFVTFIK